MERKKKKTEPEYMDRVIRGKWLGPELLDGGGEKKKNTQGIKDL